MSIAVIHDSYNITLARYCSFNQPQQQYQPSLSKALWSDDHNTGDIILAGFFLVILSSYLFKYNLNFYLMGILSFGDGTRNAPILSSMKITHQMHFLRHSVYLQLYKTTAKSCGKRRRNNSESFIRETREHCIVGAINTASSAHNSEGFGSFYALFSGLVLLFSLCI